MTGAGTAGAICSSSDSGRDPRPSDLDTERFWERPTGGLPSMGIGLSSGFGPESACGQCVALTLVGRSQVEFDTYGLDGWLSCRLKLDALLGGPAMSGVDE